jgi:hypothetical protein
MVSDGLFTSRYLDLRENKRWLRNNKLVTERGSEPDKNAQAVHATRDEYSSESMKTFMLHALIYHRRNDSL